MIPYENSPFAENLYAYVQDCFGGVDINTAKNILREAVFAPDDFVIDCQTEQLSRYEVVQKLLQYTAQKYQNQDKQSQYNSMLDEASAVIKNTNDGFISQDDAAQRENFLRHINCQEFEHFAALAVFKMTHSDEYYDLEQEILFQIKRLREINDLIIKFTRADVNSEVSKGEYERALVVYKLLKSLKGLGYGYTLSLKERKNLGINHDDDEDLDNDYAYENWIKLLMLLALRREQNINAATITNSINDLCHADEKVGHVSTILDDINGHIAELRGTMQKRRFDKTRFNMIEEVYNSDNSHYIG